MKELDLDILFKEKRDEPISVPISAVNSWLKGGALAFGLFATIKWLFTQKTTLMLTSISSISIATTVAILFLSQTDTKKSFAVSGETKQQMKQVSQVKKSESFSKDIGLILNKTQAESMDQINTFWPNHIANSQPNQLLLPQPNMRSASESPTKDEAQFSRISANGFVHFTLVKGTTCSIQNNIPFEDGDPQIQYDIKNGVLFLNSALENKASDFIITVSDLDKIDLNGFCEMNTASVFQDDELDIDINGFTHLNIDLNVTDLEIELNGETKGKMNLTSEKATFECNGFCQLDVNCDFKQSWIDMGGYSKINLMGSSIHTTLNLSGETAIEAAALISQDLFLTVSGKNKKFETTVTSNLDVEISGNNTVSIIGSPKIIRQEVMKGSRLKMQE